MGKAAGAALPWSFLSSLFAETGSGAAMRAIGPAALNRTPALRTSRRQFRAALGAKREVGPARCAALSTGHQQRFAQHKIQDDAYAIRDQGRKESPQNVAHSAPPGIA